MGGHARKRNRGFGIRECGRGVFGSTRRMVHVASGVEMLRLKSVQFRFYGLMDELLPARRTSQDCRRLKVSAEVQK